MLTNFIQTHRPKRIGVQISHQDFIHAHLINDAIEEAAKTQHPLPSIVLLGTTDFNKACTDLRHASHYKCDVIVQVGKSCPCMSGDTPVVYIDTNDLLRQTHDPPDVCVDATMAIVECVKAQTADSHVWVIGTREYPIGEDLLKIVGHLGKANLTVSQQKGSFHLVTILGEDVEHTSDDECVLKISMLYLGSSNDSLFKALSEKYATCITSTLFYLSGNRLCTTPKPAMGLAMKRSAYLSTIKEATRVGLIMADRLTDTEEETRRLIKQFLRSQKKVVVQICLDPIADTKLENFADCDCFVFIGCPSRALWLIEKSKSFRKKILTPREVLIAFDMISWSSHFDLTSVITEDMVRARVDVVDVAPDDVSAALVAVQEGRSLAIMEGHDLLPVDIRSFKGVNEEGWCEDSRSIHQGRFGIASYYVDEKSMKK